MVSVRNYHFIAEKIKKIVKEQVMLSLNVSEEEKDGMEMKLDFLLGGVTAVYAEWVRKGKPCPLENVVTMLIDCSYHGIIGKF